MSAVSDNDAAWVKLALPLSVRALNDFLQDVERLLRINPCLEFDRLIRSPDGTLMVAGKNESNDQCFDFRVALVPRLAGDGFVLSYDGGIKRESRFEIAPESGGSLLTITEVYDTPKTEDQERRLQEVDRSLVAWASALRKHLLRRQRWGSIPGYAWLVERFWLGMPPRQRRVAWLIIWTTALEFIAFIAVLAVFVTG